MTKKLDNLSKDILSLLKKYEPEVLRYHEICDILFNSSYKGRYKDKKGFGVAVSQKLKLLEAMGLIVHKDIWYGTPNSKFPEQEESSKEKEKTSLKADKFEIIDIRPEFGGVKLSIETCKKMGEPIFKVRIGNKEKLIFDPKELDEIKL